LFSIDDSSLFSGNDGSTADPKLQSLRSLLPTLDTLKHVTLTDAQATLLYLGIPNLETLNLNMGQYGRPQYNLPQRPILCPRLKSLVIHGGKDEFGWAEDSGRMGQFMKLLKCESLQHFTLLADNQLGYSGADGHVLAIPHKLKAHSATLSVVNIGWQQGIATYIEGFLTRSQQDLCTHEFPRLVSLRVFDTSILFGKNGTFETWRATYDDWGKRMHQVVMGRNK
jgi:hypothetical protein